MNLKPQDVVVALKLCTYPDARPPISIIASHLSLSSSEVHGAMGRLRASRLLHEYAFPPAHGDVTRGVPTSYAAGPLKSELSLSNDLPPVWPWPEGDTRGVGLEPLYKRVPQTALRDSDLYQLSALVDAIRDGRAREGKIADRDLVRRLRATRGQP